MWAQLRSSASDGDGVTVASGPESSKDDALDDLLKEVQAEERRRSLSTKGRDKIASSDDGKEEQTVVVEDSDELSEFVGALEELRMDLASPDVDASLRKRLLEIDDESFFRYYRDNASLREYTLRHEMSRNVYEKGGRRISDFPAGTDELVVRMANQSIFADVISCVSLGLSRLSQVGASVCACDRGGRYEIDDNSLRASLDLCVAVPTLGREKNKLLVATFPCAISVSLDARHASVRRDLGRVQLATLFDEDLRKAAAFHVEARESATDTSPTTTPPPPQFVGSSRLLRAAANSVKVMMSPSSHRQAEEEV